MERFKQTLVALENGRSLRRRKQRPKAKVSVILGRGRQYILCNQRTRFLETVITFRSELTVSHILLNETVRNMQTKKKCLFVVVIIFSFIDIYIYLFIFAYVDWPFFFLLFISSSFFFNDIGYT